MSPMHERAYHGGMKHQFPGPAPHHLDLHEVARQHYLEGLTMETIARGRGISRSTVSRMLKQARESGLVRITLVDPASTDEQLAQQIHERFGVQTHVVTVRTGVGEVNRLEHVTAAAAQLVGDVITDGARIGLAWGTTLASLVRHLEPRRHTGVRVVQINGGANAHTSGIPYVGQMIHQFASAYGAETVLFPVPAFFDNASTRDAMWRERSIKPLLLEQRSIDVAVFSVGALKGPVPSHVYVGNYLDEQDNAELSDQHVVGDVCTVFLRRDGSWEDIGINARATGLNPRELRTVEKRICVAAGTAKSEPLLGALRAGVATDLVVDDALAKAVLRAG